MPNWTWDDVALRNQRVFGTGRPAGPPIQQEAPAPHIPEALIELECCKLLSEDGWRILKTDPVSDGAAARALASRGWPTRCACGTAGRERPARSCGSNGRRQRRREANAELECPHRSHLL